MAMVDDPERLDVVVGVLFARCCWRRRAATSAPSLVILALAFVAYAFVGPLAARLPLARRRDVPASSSTSRCSRRKGVFGIPTLVSATFIYLFVVFGGVMSHGGLLRFFTDGALAVAGGTRGGAGKVAVISSGLFGTVNGSAIANAVTTGAFTIPLMMRAGYRPEFAAGVEACASMGGQLIPPVMGAAAFIMAETLGVPYGTIAFAATIPGVLYFVAVGVMVHFEAARQGLPVLPRAELPRLGAVLRRDVHLLAGPAVLVWFLVEGRSPLFAGFWALVVAFVLRAGCGATRGSAWPGCLAILVDSAQARCRWRSPARRSGIVVGVVSRPGSGSSSRAASWASPQGSLLATLVLTMIAALVLGTGLPTSATYIITSIMAAPALVQLGVPQAGRPHVRLLLRHPGRPHAADGDLDLRDLLDRRRRRVAHAVDGDDAGAVRLHHPVHASPTTRRCSC